MVSYTFWFCEKPKPNAKVRTGVADKKKKNDKLTFNYNKVYSRWSINRLFEFYLYDTIQIISVTWSQIENPCYPRATQVIKIQLCLPLCFQPFTCPQISSSTFSKSVRIAFFQQFLVGFHDVTVIVTDPLFLHVPLALGRFSMYSPLGPGQRPGPWHPGLSGNGMTYAARHSTWKRIGTGLLY